MLVPGVTLGLLGQDILTGASVDETYARQLEERCKQAGIMHVMAVSGGHYALIARLCTIIGALAGRVNTCALTVIASACAAPRGIHRAHHAWMRGIIMAMPHTAEHHHPPGPPPGPAREAARHASSGRCTPVVAADGHHAHGPPCAHGMHPSSAVPNRPAAKAIGRVHHEATVHHTPRCVIIRGGDEYLNRLAARRHARQWLDAHPDSELIEPLDAWRAASRAGPGGGPGG